MTTKAAKKVDVEEALALVAKALEEFATGQHGLAHQTAQELQALLADKS